MSRYRKNARRFKDQPVTNVVKAKPRFAVLMLSLVALLLVPTSILFTLAYQTDTTDTVINEFVPKEVVIDIVEDFDGAIKEDVKIKNTGKVDAYVRFKLAISAIDSDGNTVAMPITVIENGEKTYRGIDINDFTFTNENPTDWTDKFFEIDGIYYYEMLVPVSDIVELFDKAVFNKYMLQNDIALPITDDSDNPYYIIEGDELKSQAKEDGTLIAYDKGHSGAVTSITYMSKEYTPVLTIVAQSIQANGVEESWPVTLNLDGTITPN